MSDGQRERFLECDLIIFNEFNDESSKKDPHEEKSGQKSWRYSQSAVAVAEGENYKNHEKTYLKILFSTLFLWKLDNSFGARGGALNFEIPLIQF